MEIVRGEMDKRQLDGIVRRYNALVDRRIFPVSEAQSILSATVADLQLFFVAFGLTVDPPPTWRGA